jgi:hypothetical protein
LRRDRHVHERWVVALDRPVQVFEGGIELAGFPVEQRKLDRGGREGPA